MEVCMKAVKVSPKYQVVIPREIRETMDIRPGTKVQILLYENRIELIPVRDPARMRGFVKGIDTTVDREEDSRV
jgi:AbrB family looped-hinge helix DNA binding protein